MGRDVALALEDFMFVPAVGLMLIFVGLLFPAGRLLSRRWRWLACGSAAAIILAYVSNSLAVSPTDYGVTGATNPLRPSGAVLGVLTGLASASWLLLPAVIASAVVAMVLRYRQGDNEVRRQIRVVMCATVLFAVSFTVYATTASTSVVLEGLGALSLFAVPAGAGIAVLKYRLYDIDVVISRTLVFGSLAGFITGIYVAIVVGFGALIGSGGKPNLLLSIVATSVVAIAFHPFRERVQHSANRFVYGKRATPYEVLTHFSAHVAESYAADDVLPRMAQVLAKVTGAEHADVWLGNGPPLRQTASWPAGAEPGVPTRSVEVRHQGELLGALSVTKRNGESLTPVEEKLLDDLGHHAGLVLKNVGLTAELRQRLEDLRASRQRLVAAQDEERRRLERNLHDGAQQNLVALKLKLGLMEMLATRDPARARVLMGEVKSDADEALETLRDLARGIYPPLLAERGLGAALESQARKATIPVSVDAEGIARHAPEIEAAVYFCCLEALQNVQKYGSASQAAVRITEAGGELSFAVGDDGCGFDTATTKRGSGLQNMEDRLDALGGSLTVTSVLGGGTTLAGRLRVHKLAAA